MENVLFQKAKIAIIVELCVVSLDIHGKEFSSIFFRTPHLTQHDSLMENE